MSRFEFGIHNRDLAGNLYRHLWPSQKRPTITREALRRTRLSTECRLSQMFIFTPLSFERSSSCYGVIIPMSPHQSGEALDSSVALIRAHQQCISSGRGSDMRGEHVTTTPPTYANAFALERGDWWCARLIKRRPSSCPGCDDRLTRQSGLPSQVA
ncbi:hypothetical protein CSKR_113128 [Clonorchis sinensis]|uniref:Uncharacterized protein n=1 Tax=Clonorchis sinensis TaxID=79923 RepID=A0A3R7D7Q4_CLOSI|nr:hypothetical protein CSKR_113128 [Clonorchis sinensis]